MPFNEIVDEQCNTHRAIPLHRVAVPAPQVRLQVGLRRRLPDGLFWEVGALIT